MAQIYKVKTNNHNDPRFIHLDQKLLHPPFFICIVAPPKSGKSNLLVNIIYNLYHKCFDNIIYISPNVYNDDTLEKSVTADDDIIKYDLSEESIDEILDKVSVLCKEMKKNDQLEHTLIIIDDCLGMIKTKALDKIASKYRHFNISIIISIQVFRAMTNTVRSCATQFIIFKNNNTKEVNKMEEEFSGAFPDFLNLYHEATNEKYNFLTLDFRNMRALRNFDTILWQK